jgi:glycosyltransferase involved in cell wall biosynthesis
MLPKMLDLTIAIPTYRRPEELHRCVDLLRAQANHEFHLLIIDNASPVPASLVLEPVLKDFPALSVRIVRNGHNVGGGANILRCFEMCTTKYLWVLGDDDEPIPNATKVICDAVAQHPEAIFINFACELHARERQVMSTDLDTFLRSMDSFSNVLLTSTSVFRCDRLAAYLPFAFHYTYGMAPHITLVLHALIEGAATCVLSLQQIIVWTAPRGGPGWSVVAQLLGMGVMLDLPLSSENRTRLAQLLPRQRALEAMTIQLVIYEIRLQDYDGAMYIADQIYTRLLRYSLGPLGRARYALYRHLFLRIPSLGLLFFKAIIRSSGKGHDLLNFRDPFHR